VRGRSVVVGALFAPLPWLRLGGAWRSGLRSDFDSTRLAWTLDSDLNKSGQQEESTQAWAVLPEQFAIGLLLRPARWLDLSADYSQIEWQRSTISGYYGAGLLPYPQLEGWKTGQKPVRNLRFGLEARLPLRAWQVSLRGGFSRDSQLYADHLDRAVVVQGYSLGLGCRFSANLQLDAAYQRQRAGWLENGFFLTDVDTHFRADAFLLALTYRFGHVFKE
jgi:hypothetical protein